MAAATATNTTERIDALPNDSSTLMAVVEATGDATLGEVTVQDALRSLDGRKLARALKAAEAVQPAVVNPDGTPTEATLTVLQGGVEPKPKAKREPKPKAEPAKPVEPKPVKTPTNIHGYATVQARESSTAIASGEVTIRVPVDAQQATSKVATGTLVLVHGDSDMAGEVGSVLNPANPLSRLSPQHRADGYTVAVALATRPGQVLAFRPDELVVLVDPLAVRVRPA